MFIKSNEKELKPLIDGVFIKPMAFGEKSLICKFLLKEGHSLPAHHHPYEQTGFLILGKLKFRINAEWYDAEAGDSWSIPENIEHEVIVLEDSEVIEVFIPVREEYLNY